MRELLALLQRSRCFLCTHCAPDLSYFEPALVSVAPVLREAPLATQCQQCQRCDREFISLGVCGTHLPSARRADGDQALGIAASQTPVLIH